MRSFPKVAFIIILLVTCFISAQALAIINPVEFTKGAEEKLTVRFTGVLVEDVLKGGKKVIERSYLIAKVLKVEKSESGIKRGDSIMIRYVRNYAEERKKEKEMQARVKTGWVGPQNLHEPDLPAIGDKYLVFLDKYDGAEGVIYSPAAHQYSFDRQ